MQMFEGFDFLDLIVIYQAKQDTTRVSFTEKVFLVFPSVNNPVIGRFLHEILSSLDQHTNKQIELICN